MTRRRLARATATLLYVLVAVAICACGASSITKSARLPGPRAPDPGPVPAARARVPSGTFVSLVPACACARRTELELFSVSSGRMLRELTAVSLDGYQQLATPAATNDGLLFLTYTSGARCAPKGLYMECPRFAPDSCRNAVETLAPGQTTAQSLFSVPGSVAITGEVVPNPDGRKVALTLTPCISTHGTTGLFVRNLNSGATQAIVTSTIRCDGFGPAAWNPTGSQLVFPLERAHGNPIQMAGGFGCPGGRNYLALASATTGSAPRALKLIKPARGCIFSAAAFDRRGVVAAEGCSHGDPEHGVGSYLGNAYVLQYSARGALRLRIPIKLGAGGSRHRDRAELSQRPDHPGSARQRALPERDWLWEFNGYHLRAIAHYQADDAAQILAIPW